MFVFILLIRFNVFPSLIIVSLVGGRRGTIDKSERSFLEYLVRDQVHRHKTTIADTVGSGPLLQYLVRVSLAHTPPQVTTLRYSEAYASEKIDWESVLSNSEEGSDDDDMPASSAGTEDNDSDAASDTGSMTSEERRAFDTKFRHKLYVEFTVPGNENAHSPPLIFRPGAFL